MLEDGSRVQMNNGAVMRKPFLQTDRYSISPRQEGKTVHMPLKIAGKHYQLRFLLQEGADVGECADVTGGG